MGKKRKGHQGTCMKDPGTKTWGRGRIECGRWGWVGQERVMRGKGTTLIEQKFFKSKKQKGMYSFFVYFL